MVQTITPQQVAGQRTVQTFLSGLAIDVLVAVALLIIAQVSNITDTDALIVFFASLAKTIIIAAAQYVVRMFIVPPEKDQAVLRPRRAEWEDS